MKAGAMAAASQLGYNAMVLSAIISNAMADRQCNAMTVA